MTSFRLYLNDGCEGGHRHILLGHFPMPLFTVESRVTHDAMIPLFWPQLGPNLWQIRADSDAGSSRAVLLGSEKSGPWIGASRTWGLEEFKPRRTSTVPQLKPQSLDPAKEAVSCLALPPRQGYSWRSEI